MSEPAGHGARIGASTEHLKADMASALELNRMVAARIAADTGERHDLDDVIAALGFDRAELESDMADEPHE